MNKINVYLLTFLLSLAIFPLPAQQGRRALNTNVQEGDIFYHTIERGQTVYSIATMYNASVDDIYRLNPESRTVIKAGETLKIPQQRLSASGGRTANDRYIYHTIQPKETLYALSNKYEIPATEIIRENPGLSVATFSIGKIIRIPAVYRPEGQVRDRGQQAVTPPAAEPVLRNEPEVNALLNQAWDGNPLDRIQVVLLLPFMSDQARISPDAARIVEYYEGMLMAVDSLRNMGFSIELSVFDIGMGTQKLSQVLNDRLLESADLIIGAVQNEQIKPIAEFAGKNKIKYVIPFTSNNDEVLSNAYVFQINPPQSYLYAGAAKTACDLYKDDNIVILNIGDDREKPEFIGALKAEMKHREIPFKELAYSAETFLVDAETMFTHDKRNVVIPTSASLEAVNNIKSPLRILAEVKTEERDIFQVTMFGYPEWQTYTRDCLEDFYALNACIYTSFYADNLSPEVQHFYTSYKNWFSKIPVNIVPKYGILGFDTGMYFFSALRKYGRNFEGNIDKIDYKSIQTGFRFNRVNNWGGFINTNLFIVQYQSNSIVTRRSVK